MSDRDPGHRSRRSARFEIRPTLGRTALVNRGLSGGLLPPPRRCARNEKKDKRSLVEKEIDTGACLIDAYWTGVSCLFFVSDVMRHAPPGARVGTLALDRSASAGTGGVNGSVHRS